MTTLPTERILTLHPAGKRGVNIERATYDAMRRALLRVIPRRVAGVAFGDLADLVTPLLEHDTFPPDASVTWYVVAVKQDLEARGTIEQVPGVRPQYVRRVTGGAGRTGRTNPTGGTSDARPRRVTASGPRA